MQKINLRQLVSFIDQLLQIDQIQDWPEAHNGLQVENDGTVHRIAAAVDASLATICMAIDLNADLLIVHHGLFWTQRLPWTGTTYHIMKLLVQHNLAVYSAHLPLDVHPTFGNTSQLCRALGIERAEPCLFDQKRNLFLGLKSEMSCSVAELVDRIKTALGTSPRLIPAGPKQCRRVGVVTGSGGSLVFEAAREGIDTLITGEGPHWTFSAAEELGINLIYAGHYGTETLGVRALAEHLSKSFGLPWVFLDHPSGL